MIGTRTGSVGGTGRSAEQVGRRNRSVGGTGRSADHDRPRRERGSVVETYREAGRTAGPVPAVGAREKRVRGSTRPRRRAVSGGAVGARLGRREAAAPCGRAGPKGQPRGRRAPQQAPTSAVGGAENRRARRTTRHVSRRWGFAGGWNAPRAKTRSDQAIIHERARSPHHANSTRLDRCRLSIAASHQGSRRSGRPRRAPVRPRRPSSTTRGRRPSRHPHNKPHPRDGPTGPHRPDRR